MRLEAASVVLGLLVLCCEYAGGQCGCSTPKQPSCRWVKGLTLLHGLRGGGNGDQGEGAGDRGAQARGGGWGGSRARLHAGTGRGRGPGIRGDGRQRGRALGRGDRAHRRAFPGVSARHRELNTHITGAADEEALCGIVLGAHDEFNAVNAATAYRKLILRDYGRGQSRGYGARQPSALGARCCETLEETLTKQMHDCEARQCANILHALAKSRRKAGAGMLSALTSQIEAVARDFNSQDVANTLWAFATMGQTPGE